ncbi:RNA 2'-phosphotransferase [Roseivivax sp. THAF40]|uniref:RNA 2'-phosphotransferase n=1 Tax=Roseivivax sp. THAF40 TaxID=2587858 RepID=UPI0012686EC1|nr:RNA 2'-phosphotransferase [Roseivivax sp. THAF40]QFT45427.1 RNA 2'-phosphotransferase [Roseivivax sp. THAF40]
MSRESRFLSLVLRHKPEEIGLKLDGAGWVEVDNLLRALKRSGRGLSRDALEKVVAENDKRRFTISEDGRRIRAAQGHSVEVDLELPPSPPPASLYHGTARGNLDEIFRIGILPRRRRQVHLSCDAETALSVGQRHGKAVVLQIAAAAMASEGYTFHCADNGVWLTDEVPPTFIGFATNPLPD